LLRYADFTAHYLSAVTSDEIRSAHFALELLCLHEQSWVLTNNSNSSMSLSVGKIDNLLSAALC